MAAATAQPITGAGPALLALRKRLRPVRHRKGVLEKMAGITWEDYLKIESGDQPVASPTVLRNLIRWIGASEAEFAEAQATAQPAKKK